MTYRYAGDDMVDDLPEYTITELPEGYAEDRDQRIEFGTQTYKEHCANCKKWWRKCD